MFEFEIIKYYETTDNKYGYNKCCGGHATPPLQEKTKDKIRKSLRGRAISKETRIKISKANKGRKMSEENRKKASERNKGKNNYFYGKRFTGEKHWLFGKTHSNESKSKISENHYNKRSIVCLETNKTYKSISSAAKEMNLNKVCIQNCCAGNIHSTGGFHFVYYENFINNDIPEYKNKHFKSVICLETGIVYNTIKDAADKTRINKNSIRNCCKGKCTHARGYHWEYYNENK